MNELTEILEEIKEDNTSNVETISEEDKVLLKEISEEDVLKVSGKVELESIYEANENLDRVDKNIVLEAFTAMSIDREIEEAKLTTEPSYINKEILTEFVNKSLNDDSIAIVSDETESFKLILEQAENSKKLLEGLIVLLDNSIDLIADEALVIYQAHTYNLLRDSLSKLTDIDDRSILYKPYEGKLSDLIYCLNLKTLSFINKELGFSLSNDINILDLITVMKNILKFNEDFLESLKDLLTVIESDRRVLSVILKAIVTHNEIVRDYDRMYYLYKDLTSSESKLDYLAKYLKLIAGS